MLLAAMNLDPAIQPVFQGIGSPKGADFSPRGGLSVSSLYPSTFLISFREGGILKPLFTAGSRTKLEYHPTLWYKP